MRYALAAGLLLVGVADLAAIDLVLLPRYVGGATRLAPVLSVPPAATGPSSQVAFAPPPAPEQTPPPPAEPAPVAPAPAPPTPAPPTMAESSAPTFPNLLFARNTSWLSPAARETLARLAATLAEQPSRRVVIGGHTDNSGPEELNRALSLERARRCGDWLEAARRRSHTHRNPGFRLVPPAGGRPNACGPGAQPKGRDRPALRFFMSILAYLVIASLVAALAFFLAGVLLRSSRMGGADLGKEVGRRETLEGESERLGEEQKKNAAALDEAKAECKAEASARKLEEEKRALAERERDSARDETERLSAKERTLAERLRTAEDENRAAFERQEKEAEAWGAQLQASKAEQKRQDQVLHEEIEQLRAKAIRQEAEQARLVRDLEQRRHEVGRLESEQARLIEERAQHEARAGKAERALEDLRGRSQGQNQDVDGERERLQKALLAAEEREREVLRRLAEVEVSWQGKGNAAEEALRSMQAAARAEKQQLVDQLARAEATSQGERDEKRDLATRLRALEEAVAHERQQGRTASEALRVAETRLADLDRLAQENSELREQQAEFVREAKWQAGRGDEAKDVKVELAAAQAKLAELGRTLEENRRLRDEAAELRQLQEASGELERLTTAHKQLRLDAELMARRLQELMQDRNELVSLRSQAAEAASLVEEVAYLRRREKDLEAQLYASGMYASREIPAVSGEVLVHTPVSNMETNLHSLVGAGGPRTAVLADAQGFLIASAGESGAQEGLAAFAAVAGEMVSRARMLLPLADVDSVRVTDRNRMVLTCHLFDSAGEGLGMATLGPGEPEAANTERAIVELAALVSGSEPALDQEPDEEPKPAS